MISIIFLSLLGYCFLLKRFTKWPIECLPFLAISACIVILYIAAYAHFLPVAANVILIGGLFSLFVLYQARHQLWAEYLTPGFVIPLLFVVLFLLLTHGTHFSQWDEFTHWGPHAKLVLYHNGFIDAADAAVNKTYPLGSALFYYLFSYFTGYSESVAYKAQCIITLAPLSIFVSRFQWHAWKKVFISYGLILIFLFLLKVHVGVVNSLYMDNIVGIYFGMTIVFYLTSSRSRASIYYLIPIIIAFTLLKEKLYPLVWIITALIMVDQIFIQKQRKITRVFLPLLI